MAEITGMASMVGKSNGSRPGADRDAARYREAAEGLAAFLEESPSMFHAVAAACRRLDAAGFARLAEGDGWSVEPGRGYYAVRNGSSVIAFRVGEAAHPQTDDFHFKLTASHSDSPTFKVKAVPELAGVGESLRLNVEAYGGMIDYTWFDRPLSIAGRVLVRDGNRIESRLIAPDRDLLLIPSVAVHLDRGVNSGFAPNRQVDLCPLFSAGKLERGAFDALVAEEVGAVPEQVLARDLFLANRQKPCIWGAADEFFSAPKLDDLACAYVSLEAFLRCKNDAAVSVWCCFDNEEVGSNTKQGAMSTFLPDVLMRVCAALGGADEDYRRALAKSMLVSCDNAHAVHPNHPEKYDEANRCVLNGGIAVKEAANQHYCTDAFSRAAFLVLCADAGTPVQTFANRSDTAGGSTLGNLSNIQASMHAIDVGLPQLAMHSSFETMGALDVLHGIRAVEAFYGADLRIDGADAVTIG
ncbi:MAG: M18 family aminopeptidase [Slackia sp.]|nr:M18 family aminopeptidase [Slackia sp.]